MERDDQLSVTTIRGLPSGAFRLDGLTALITGASRNIGAAVAKAFAEAGADLLLVARGEVRLSGVAARIREVHPERKVVAVSADVSQRDEVSRLLELAEGSFSSIDVLVNNAFSNGGSRGIHILESSDESWDEAFRTNLLAPLRLSRGVGRALFAKDQHGSIINVLSGSGFQPNATLGPYGCSKAALWMLTRYLALECGPLIRVNAICPGLISDTGGAEGLSEVSRSLLRSAALGRVGRPDEVAGAAVYLASAAASYTTGTVIFCNGGRPW